MIPSLPQSESTFGAATRSVRLAAARNQYSWNFNSRVAPLGIAESLPKGEGFSPLTLGAQVVLVLGLLDNLLSAASRLLASGGKLAVTESLAEAEIEAVEGLVEELSAHRGGLLRIAEKAGRPYASRGLLTKAVEGVVDAIDGDDESPLQLLESIIKSLAKAAVMDLLKVAGLAGPARSMDDYLNLFNMLLLPSTFSSTGDDRFFAWSRLAGPNPMVIAGVEAVPAGFPVTDAMLAAVTGAGDTLAAAGAEGRLFLCDYAALADVPAGTFPHGRKYMEPALALFATPPAGAADRALMPVAIQLGQQSNHATPVFTPADGPIWQIAQLHVTVADGNHHEMISHLGLTHLVLEAFVMVTHRQLSTEHPLYVLLMPHFQGTLAINQAAEQTLVAPKGTVDRLLAGTIEGTTKLAVDAVAGLNFREAALPRDLARRKVDNAQALPVYPFRDDALPLWGAIESWVRDYLSVYYPNDSDITGDTELSAWLCELENKDGGAGLTGVGPIATLTDLVEVVTQVIFRASVQHAAVNFPQRSFMSPTPVFPLAAYTPAPTSTGEAGGDEAVLRLLAPLEDALAQQALLELLGGVYFTRLGDYDRYRMTPYFADPRIQPLVAAFQGRLRGIERQVGLRNLERTPYTTLLPSAIPQSINI